MMCEMKRIFAIKTLWILVNLACTAILTVQLSHVLEGFIRPTITRTWEEEVDLKDIDFPAVVKICVIPGFNQTALNEVGYFSTFSYFLGRSRFNPIDNWGTIGWAGHKEDSGTYGTVEEVLAKISDYKLDNILHRVFVWNKDREIEKIPLERLNASWVNYPNNCRSLFLSKIPELKGKHIQRLILDIHNGQLGQNPKIKIDFIGDTLHTRRDILKHSFQSMGDFIRLDKDNVIKQFVVDISQRVFVEEDPSNTCRDYPNEEYLSYGQCDDEFMRNQLPGGLTPVWMTEDFEEVSTKFFVENDTLDALRGLIVGDHVSDCLLPCKTTQTQTKFVFETKGEGTGIDIFFNSKVRVTKTDLVWPTFTNFLSEVGGSMGLWLGLGVVQMFELSVNCLLLVWRKYKGNQP